MVHRGPAARTDSDVTGLDRLGRRLEERRVDDPNEGPPRFVNQAQPPPDLQPGGTQQALGLRAQTSSEEDTVARPGANLPDQSRTLGFGDVLGDRPAQLAIVADQHIRQPAMSSRPSELLPGIQLPAGLARPAWHHDSPDVVGLEHAE